MDFALKQYDALCFTCSNTRVETKLFWVHVKRLWFLWLETLFKVKALAPLCVKVQHPWFWTVIFLTLEQGVSMEVTAKFGLHTGALEAETYLILTE